jgi:hypothetical protein
MAKRTRERREKRVKLGTLVELVKKETIQHPPLRMRPGPTFPLDSFLRREKKSLISSLPR